MPSRTIGASYLCEPELAGLSGCAAPFVNKKDPVSLPDNGSRGGVSNGIRTRDLRNHNPKDSGYKCLPSPEVTTTCAPVGPQVGQKSRRDDSSDDDFSAAVLAVMAHPLSDSEKAEVVRRLLAR